MTVGTVAVLFGGRGVEHDVSRLSAASVCKAFPKEFDPYFVYIDRAGDLFHYIGDPGEIGGGFKPTPDALVPTFPVRLFGVSGFLEDGRVIPVFAALPILHGDFGEDGRIQGALDVARIPCAGAGVAAGVVTTDKEFTKLLAAALGIPTVPSVAMEGVSAEVALATASRTLGREGYPYPLFLKPASLGSSVGAARVGSDETFSFAYAEAAKYGKVLIERYLPGVRELECAYLAPYGDEPAVVSMPGEIRSPAGFYDYEEKYGSGAEVSDAPTLPTGVADAVRDYTTRLAEKLAGIPLFRADFFLCPDGQIFFNEINPMPGMTDASLYPRLTARAGVPFPAMLRRLILLAHDRAV